MVKNLPPRAGDLGDYSGILAWRIPWTEEPDRLCLSHLKVNVAQSCPTLCDPMDYTVHEILQARILGG